MPGLKSQKMLEERVNLKIWVKVGKKTGETVIL